MPAMGASHWHVVEEGRQKVVCTHRVVGLGMIDERFVKRVGPSAL